VNTLAGVRAALAIGVDAIEVDVHVSADGVPVIIHDPTLDRTTTGTGLVRQMPFEGLRRLDAGRLGFNGRFAGERIPSLTEVVEATAGRCLLVVEIKQPGIAPLVVDRLRSANAIAGVMVWSFDLETVAEVRRLEPDIPAALLVPPGTLDLPSTLSAALRPHLSGVSLHYRSVDRDSVDAAHLHGLSVFAWTADEPAEQRRLRDFGVDGIVSNVPDVLAKALTTTP